MELRKYIKESAAKGVKSAYNIYGENTHLFFAERFATKKSNGSEQLIFTMSFEDLGFDTSSKFNTENEKEAKYIEYAISMLEYDTLEEFYKACLLLVKNRLIEAVETFDKIKAEYEKSGQLPWPYTTKKRFEEYESSVKKYRKMVNSTDIKESDLKLIKCFV